MSDRSNIRDVAARAGVAVKTVSRVLNGHPYVSAPMREKVECAMAELEFRPSVAARILSGSKSNQIALIYDNHSPYYMFQIQSGCWECCKANGIRHAQARGDIRRGTECRCNGVRDALVGRCERASFELGTVDRCALRVETKFEEDGAFAQRPSGLDPSAERRFIDGPLDPFGDDRDGRRERHTIDLLDAALTQAERREIG